MNNSVTLESKRTWGPSGCCLWRVTGWPRRPWQQAGERRRDQRADTAQSGRGRRTSPPCWDRNCFFGRSWHCAGWVSAADCPHLRSKTFPRVRTTRLQRGRSVVCKDHFWRWLTLKQVQKYKHGAVPAHSATFKIWKRLMTRRRHGYCGSRRQRSSAVE